MAGGKVINMLITGASGSGKSVYVNQFLRALKPSFPYLVICNTSPELAEHCSARVYLGPDELARSYNPARLAAQIRACGSVHFEIAGGCDAEGFMSALGFALRELGAYDAEAPAVLLVMDECHNFVPKRAMPRGILWAETEGRKYGVHLIKITQTLASTSNHTIHMVSLTQVNKLVVFPLSNQVQRKRVMSEYPECPDPVLLQFPDPERNIPGDYVVIDRLSGKTAGVWRADLSGRRRVIWIQGRAA